MGGNGGTKALEMLRSLPRVCLANLRPSPGSKKPVSARSLPGGVAYTLLSGGRAAPSVALRAVGRSLGRRRQAPESGLAKIRVGRRRNGWRGCAPWPRSCPSHVLQPVCAVSLMERAADELNLGAVVGTSGKREKCGMLNVGGME